MLAQATHYLFLVLMLSIIGRAVLSLLRRDAPEPVGYVLFALSEPFLGPIGRGSPTIKGFNLAPVFALLLLAFLESLIVPALAYFG